MNKLFLSPESNTRLKLDLAMLNKGIKERRFTESEYRTEIEEFKMFLLSLNLMKEQQLYLLNTLTDVATHYSIGEYGVAKYQMNQVTNRIEKLLNGK